MLVKSWLTGQLPNAVPKVMYGIHSLHSSHYPRLLDIWWAAAIKLRQDLVPPIWQVHLDHWYLLTCSKRVSCKRTTLTIHHGRQGRKNGRMGSEWVQNGLRMGSEWVQNGFRMIVTNINSPTVSSWSANHQLDKWPMSYGDLMMFSWVFMLQLDVCGLTQLRTAQLPMAAARYAPVRLMVAAAVGFIHARRFLKMGNPQVMDAVLL